MMSFYLLLDFMITQKVKILIKIWKTFSREEGISVQRTILRVATAQGEREI